MKESTKTDYSDPDEIANLAGSLTHDELIEITQSSLCTLLSCDPLLSDLPSDVVLEEVLSQIAVEHGQAITVFLNREDEPPLKVINCVTEFDHMKICGIKNSTHCKNLREPMQFIIEFLPYLPIALLMIAGVQLIHGFFTIPQNATVRELKKAIRRHFEFYQKRTKNKVKVSWKYIWKTYDLSFDSIVLDDDDSSIEDYSVVNKVVLSFKKKRRKKR